MLSCRRVCYAVTNCLLPTHFFTGAHTLCGDVWNVSLPGPIIVIEDIKLINNRISGPM